MTRKKQIILPFVILIIGILLTFAFISMRKPPEAKVEVVNTPIVSVETITVSPMTLNIESYGIVKPKYETEMVAQVSGQIVELSPLFVPGGFVTKGQLLARIDPSDYEANLIDAEANMASAEASLEQETAQGKVAESEWETITNASPSELSLRKPQLAQELAKVKAAQASVLRAKRNLERTEIRAPYDAMIESRNIGLGSFVSVTFNVGKLLGTAVAEIRLPVADQQLKFLDGSGVDTIAMLEGTYSGETKEWSAKIIRSEGVIDSTSRMNYLVAEVKDPYVLTSQKANVLPLRFGSYVNAQIIGQHIEQATTLPRYLVKEGRVALLDEESTLHYAEINIIRNSGANVIISGGLKSGDQIIVSTLEYPIEGMNLALTGDKDNLEKEDNTPTAEIASVED
ncbi:efflux RND transporter periplasmic adaptor subunit [Pseudocolwellia sp. HL-MZ19]|uniref:efflux RND transporter periplasmic adaptor subunit n=1 Tax=unclassified Pseudocolwellia TaxID=2848178 RepID=UPI003CE75F8A